MKRIFQRKVKLASCRTSVAQMNAQMAGMKREQGECALQDAYLMPRTSATALGLALSVVASGFVLPQHDNRVAAAELPVPTSSISNSQPAQADVQGNLNSFRVLQSVSVTQAPRSAAVKAVRQPLKHIVREGDTLWSLSRSYRVSPSKLALANSLSEDGTLQIGQALVIPSDEQPITELPSHPQQVAISNQELQTERNLAHLQIRRLAAGMTTDRDTPSDTTTGELNVGIAPPDGSSLSERQPRNATQSDANQAVADLRVRREQLRSTLSSIRSGSLPISSFPANTQGVDIPEKLARVMSSESSRFDARSTPSSSLRRDLVPSQESTVPRLMSYQLQPGDTLAAIANRHHVSLRAIVEANSISNPNRVFVGQTIQIPVSSSQIEATHSPQEASDSVRALTDGTSEMLVSALPQNRFSTTDRLVFSAAPVVPLPISTLETTSPDASDRLEESLDESGVSTDGHATAGPASGSEMDNESTARSLTLSEQEEGVSSFVEQATDTDSADNEVSGHSSDIYVENLIDDIEELEPPASSEIEQAILDQMNRIASQDVAFRTSYRPDQSYLERQDAINPEFQAEPIEINDSDLSNTSVPDADSPEQLLAAAPLGSENYQPLSQPVTGRMVSPELPPLPGFEHYIPNGEATFNGYLWPARGVLTSGYGWRWGRMHRGIDIAAPVGTPIYAAAPGVIEFSGWNSGGYGNMVDIRHPDGSKTRYAHNSRNLVRVGQQVTQGQQIAEMGSTGYSTGPHVHFEIHLPDSGTVNPIAYLPNR